MDIENRKVQYLLNCAEISFNDLFDRFNKIDKAMEQIIIGSKIYNCNCWGDVFEQTVINILDKENGLVELNEESINQKTKGCILDYSLSLKEISRICC